MKRKYRTLKFPIKLATPLDKILKLTKLSPSYRESKLKSKKTMSFKQKNVNIEIELEDQKS